MQVAKFQQAFASEVQRQQAAFNRQLTTVEKQDIADKLTIRHKEESGQWWKFGMGDFEGSAFDYIYQDIDDPQAYDDTIKEITAGLTRRGMPVTADNILKIYKATK